jgi:UDP-N-acetylmuramoyl-L-alanyl-D-glutamate--2,6-diaminopimelate ligase
MLSQILTHLKKILGENLTNFIRPLGHGIKSYLAAVYFGFPSKKLKLIGITGTKGKTTTTVFVGKLLNLSGIKTGFISSSLINDGNQQSLNKYHMGTIDGFWLQKTLKDMVKNNCKIAVLEMTSIGLAQNRHWGLSKFSAGCILNMYPEHLKSHNGWGNYKKAKAILFKNLAKNSLFLGHSDGEQIFLDNIQNIKSNLVQNPDFKAENISKKVENQNDIVEFMWKNIPKKISQTVTRLDLKKDVDYFSLDTQGMPEKFIKIGESQYFTNLLSEVEISNLAVAISVCQYFCKELKIDFDQILSKALPNLYSVPGRMEFVLKYGEVVFKSQESKSLTYKSNFLNFDDYKNLDFLSPLSKNLSILVDYAHEPQSMQKLLETLNNWKKEGFYDKIIHLVSCDGAGRDDWKKPILGKLSFEMVDFSILTTDNYELKDKPEEILDLLAQDLPKENLNQKYFREINRRLAIKKSLFLAKEIHIQDSSKKILLVSTGVGTEAFLTQPNVKLSWDERQVWLEEFLTIYSKSQSNFGKMTRV